jgi:hypothetical protein
MMGRKLVDWYIARSSNHHRASPAMSSAGYRPAAGMAEMTLLAFQFQMICLCSQFIFHFFGVIHQAFSTVPGGVAIWAKVFSWPPSPLFSNETCFDHLLPISQTTDVLPNQAASLPDFMFRSVCRRNPLIFRYVILRRYAKLLSLL